MKYILLLLLMIAGNVNAQAVKTRVVTFNVIDSVFTMIGDTVLDGKYYDDNIMNRNVSYMGVPLQPEYQAKQYRDKSTLSNTHVDDPFTATMVNGGNPNAFQLKVFMPFRPKANRVTIVVSSTKKTKVLADVTIKSYE